MMADDSDLAGSELVVDEPRPDPLQGPDSLNEEELSDDTNDFVVLRVGPNSSGPDWNEYASSLSAGDAVAQCKQYMEMTQQLQDALRESVANCNRTAEQYKQLQLSDKENSERCKRTVEKLKEEKSVIIQEFMAEKAELMERLRVLEQGRSPQSIPATFSSGTVLFLDENNVTLDEHSFNRERESSRAVVEQSSNYSVSSNLTVSTQKAIAETHDQSDATDHPVSAETLEPTTPINQPDLFQPIDGYTASSIENEIIILRMRLSEKENQSSAEVGSLKNQLHIVEDKLSLSETMNHDLKKKLHDTERQTAQSQEQTNRQLKEQNGEIATLKEDSRKLRTRVSELTKENALLNSNASEEKESFTCKIQDMAMRQAEILAQREKANKDLEISLHEIDTRYQQLQSQFQSQQTKLAEIQSRYHNETQIRNQIDLALRQHQQLCQTEHGAKQQQFVVALKDTEKQLRAKTEELAELKRKAKENQDSTNLYKEQAETFKRDFHQERREHEIVQRQVRELSMKIRELDNEKHELKNQLDARNRTNLAAISTRYAEQQNVEAPPFEYPHAANTAAPFSPNPPLAEREPPSGEVALSNVPPQIACPYGCGKTEPDQDRMYTHMQQIHGLTE